MRISTSQIFNEGVQAMDSQQSNLNTLYQEISSGTSLLTPSSNPVGAAQAVQITQISSTLTQYTSNQNTALSSLQLEDKTLSSVTSIMTSIQSAIVSAGNATLTDANRAAIAQTLEADRNQLLSLANTTNSTGNYVFAGFQTSTQPFTNNPSGGVTYNGDSGISDVQVTSTTQVAINDPGSSVFMSVPSVGSSPIAAGSSSNTGTGTIAPPAVTNPGATTNNDSYTITFGGTAAAPTYTVTDTTTGTTTTPAAFSANTPIQLGSGMSVTISGAPNPNDTFTVTPPTSPANSSVFSTIDSVISALQTPVSGSSAAQATLTNELQTGLARMQNSLAAVSTVQASVGGRGQQLQALQTVTQNYATQTQTDLSNVTSTNITQAITQLDQAQQTLQAAQLSFSKIQGMSLFQYLQ
jgi:flagellar hook-associated protein 3 FlgL